MKLKLSKCQARWTWCSIWELYHYYKLYNLVKNTLQRKHHKYSSSIKQRLSLYSLSWFTCSICSQHPTWPAIYRYCGEPHGVSHLPGWFHRPPHLTMPPYPLQRMLRETCLGLRTQTTRHECQMPQSGLSVAPKNFFLNSFRSCWRDSWRREVKRVPLISLQQTV